MKSLTECINRSLVNETNFSKNFRIVDDKISQLKPSKEDMVEICKFIASLDDESACGYFYKQIKTKFPSIDDNVFIKEYKEALNILTKAYPDPLDD